MTTMRWGSRRSILSLLIGVFLATSAWVLFADTTSSRSQITFSIEDIRSPVFSAQGIRVKFAGEKLSKLSFHLQEVVVQGRIWRDLGLTCDEFKLTGRVVDCADGVLHLPNSEPLPVVFRYVFDENVLNIEMKPSADERWQFSLHWDEKAWRSELAIINGQATRIAQWLPNADTLPVPDKGVLNGIATLNGHSGGIAKIKLALNVNDLAFSDSSGLHAGENINAAMTVAATRKSNDKQWQWQVDLDWQHGGVFWQPLYLTGRGHQLNLKGQVSETNIHLQQGQLNFVDIGEFEFSGVVARQGYELIDFNLDTNSLELSALFDQLLNPFLGDTAFADMQVTGQSRVTWQYHSGINRSFALDLYDVSVIDQRKRFAFHRINAHVPWQKENATIADIGFLHGHLLQIPLGEVRASLEVNDVELRIPQLVLPILDGTLELENFKASQQTQGWHWQFSAELLPISMEKLTDALQIPKMHGILSGIIPHVSYEKSIVAVDGELSFDIFDGVVTAKQLKLINPLGFAPHLQVDLEMRDLDLDLLTRAFSFGNMQGRIDMEMHNLELSDWQPIRFDAHLYSSPGDYPRRISQAAIQNITALGGAGAVAAIQRSFLRFFEAFSYSEIGWRCALRENICRMGGIETAAQLTDAQGYTLVKGGGIPAITVMGYNRNVSWQELINRLKRITAGNEPIIQ